MPEVHEKFKLLPKLYGETEETSRNQLTEGYEKDDTGNEVESHLYVHILSSVLGSMNSGLL